MDFSPIGIFDSGAGGLNILSACRRVLPYENFLYLADRSHAPYGNRSQGFITARAFECTNRLLANSCKAIVIACNTATNAAIQTLRQSFCQPIIGVEPALKPASEEAKLKRIVLLCTPATANTEKFRTLFSRFGVSRITVAPQPDLAKLIEENFSDLEQIRLAVYGLLNPYSDADAFILGCTHYHFITPFIQDFFARRGQVIRIFDSGRGTGIQLKAVLKKRNLLTGKKTAGGVKVVLI